ncbi:unnamed protein product [Trypanosoma congolense IL3000]|uniref:WGS project CAEQ00000000 data, annotated contig 1686 n=1 Tax=Trypanosoma congolense (strain IL3000) TaxID=1068625 RepID=F9W804_TRYCI|nr:unnamed protein product [Trypanosoma congolense IL3000]
MTLLSAVGIRSAPLAQARRGSDGVRGVFAKRYFKRGDLLLSVPLHSCYFPHASPVPRKLRRWNRSTLIPEVPLWLWRFSPDIPEDRVTLTASASTEECKVVTVSLSPVEAALAVSIAVRHFWRNVICLKDSVGSGRAVLGPPADRRADLYMRSLPLKEYLSYGLEAPYVSGAEFEGHVHSNLEQIAWNLRDCLLSYASQQEYSLYDAYAAELDVALLASIYVVRARVMRMAVIRGDNPKTDGLTSVIAPCVDCLNHSSHETTCTACTSLPNRAVIVRAARDINVGEELTVDYRGFSLSRVGARAEIDPSNALGEDEDIWESRYLFPSDLV